MSNCENSAKKVSWSAGDNYNPADNMDSKLKTYEGTCGYLYKYNPNVLR